MVNHQQTADRLYAEEGAGELELERLAFHRLPRLSSPPPVPRRLAHLGEPIRVALKALLVLGGVGRNRTIVL